MVESAKFNSDGDFGRETFLRWAFSDAAFSHSLSVYSENGKRRKDKRSLNKSNAYIF